MDLTVTNSTESILDAAQNVSLNLTHSDYNATENINVLLNATDIHANKSDTNTTVFEQRAENNVTTNTTFNGNADMNTTTTGNSVNITDSNNTALEQTHEVTNNLTDSSNTNLTTTNSTKDFLQNMSNEEERPKRGIDNIVIHSLPNITNMNTTANSTDMTKNYDLQKTDSFLPASTTQTILSEAEIQTEKVCLIQGEEVRRFY